ncbi:hypothetical protein AGR2A_Cc80044 [Agrobacterium genomosp. 2 str. CFBP 5494]|uniref:Uncharacterized protein n=1 Tax=Agrobacterium genomosp. 2 str. CFBP 5494 TaxID=1183436 RepID=A0A9W5B291_9HYPH|nr:hypothetical protein AGR2A_Cc80044 [Agrobacterium genomosp. 2 str. CFBP 5494]
MAVFWWMDMVTPLRRDPAPLDAVERQSHATACDTLHHGDTRLTQGASILPP